MWFMFIDFFLSCIHNRSEKLRSIVPVSVGVTVGTCEFKSLFSSGLGHAGVCSFLRVSKSVKLDLLEWRVTSCVHIDTEGKRICIFQVVLWKSLYSER